MRMSNKSMMKRNIVRLLLSCAAVMAAAHASAQIYECSDAAGFKQYAQFCPLGTVKQRLIFSGGAGAAPGAGTAESIELQDAQFRKRMQERQQAEAKAEQDKNEAAEALRNCTDARGRLRALDEGQRMSRIDPVTGERVQFGDEERAADAQQQRKAVEQWCKQ